MIPQQKTQEGDIIKWQLDTTQFLMRLEKWLLGQTLIINEKTKKPEWKRTHKPLVSKEGARIIIQLLSNYISKDTALSDLSKEDIDDIAENINKNLTLLFFMKWYEWKLDKKLFRSIITQIVDKCYIFLKRAKDKNTLEYLQPVQKIEQIIRNERPETNKPSGLLGLFQRGENNV